MSQKENPPNPVNDCHKEERRIGVLSQVEHNVEILPAKRNKMP